MASYALLLRSAPAALVSPRLGPSSPGGSIDFRKSWRECLEAPTEFKSFSFARLCLIPALQRPSKPVGPDCETHEFYLSVLSHFSAHYMDVLSASGDRPISRAMWLQDAEQDLQLRRTHQESQRQFQAWSGTRNTEMAALPAAVNLMDRPDCMEDVVALAVSLCMLGPSYAMYFWTTAPTLEDGNTELVQSRALRGLERQKEEDSTLEPCYFALLAAIATASDPDLSLSGADAIHAKFMSQPGGANLWASSIGILRYYARALDPDTYGSVNSTNKAAPGVQQPSSRAYYYEGNPNAGDWSSYTSAQGKADDQTTKPKTLELGEQNTAILMSHLKLLCNVATYSPAARVAILSIALPPDGLNLNDTEPDSAIMIFFSLAMTPISSDLRGAVFRTLGMLLRTDGAAADEKLAIEEAAMKAWEMLENCQIFPVYLFEQFPSVQESAARNIARLAFPPSSLPLVSVVITCWMGSCANLLLIPLLPSNRRVQAEQAKAGCLQTPFTR